MSAITKAAAAQLVADIRSATVAAHEIGERSQYERIACTQAAQLGAIESVLQHFLRVHGCSDAADALRAAMNDVPTAAEIEARLLTRYPEPIPTGEATDSDFAALIEAVRDDPLRRHFEDDDEDCNGGAS